MNAARPSEGVRTAARQGGGIPINAARPPEGVRTAARQGGGRLASAARPLVLLLAGLCLGAQAAEPLTVCMAADNAPLSHQVNGQPRGLDVRIAQAAADRLGRPLKVVPFESDYEKESSLAHEVNALLSSGVCEAASGFPLLTDDLGPASRPSARTPDYPGAKRKRERPFVPLGTLVASGAYQAVALGLVQRAPAAGREPLLSLVTVKQTEGTRLGVVSGTLASAVAVSWRSGTLRTQLVSLGQRDDPMALLAQPQPTIDAVLMPLALWDGWRLQHPGNGLMASTWRRPIGVNLGFVTLAPSQAVRDALLATLTQARSDGSLARWAADEGVSWLTPETPDVSRGPSLASLAGD
jgi:ABC-type amino acid transport substrate-binding protein